MTREHIIEQIKSYEQSIPYGEWGLYQEDVISIMDSIFDNFKNRSCNNCKHLNKHEYSDDKCKNGVSTYWKNYIDDKYDFSCNMWESL